MGAGDVNLDITARVDAAMRQIDRLTKQVDQLKQKNAELSAEGKKGAREHADALGNVGREILGMATGYLSVRSAINLVNAELQNQIDLRRKAAEATMTEAEAERQFFANTLSNTDAEREAHRERIAQLSQETGVSKKMLYETGSAIFSAKGQVSAEGAYDALKEAARFWPSGAEQRSLGVGGIVLTQALGTGRVKEAMGLLAQTARLAQVYDWEKIGRYAPPMMIGAMEAGATPAEAGALFATLTHGRSEQMGRTSRQMGLELVSKLAQWFPEKDQPIYSDIHGISVQTGTRKGVGKKLTVGEGFERLQKDPVEAEKFAQFYGPGALEWSPLRSLLGLQGTEGPRNLPQMFKSFVAQMPTGAQAAADWDRWIGVMNRSPTQQVARFGRGLAAERESIQAANLPAARAGFIQKEVPEILQQVGQTALARKIQETFAAAQAPEVSLDRARNQIRAAREAIQPSRFATITPEGRLGTVSGTEPPPEGYRYARRSEVSPFAPEYRGAIGPPEPLTEFQKQSIRVMDETKTLIEQQLEEVKAGNRKRSAAGAGVTDTHKE